MKTVASAPRGAEVGDLGLMPRRPNDGLGCVRHLHWKKGLSIVGLQLIATGHSLVDMYMAFEVDEYARLYKLTHDAHYRDVAELLLHGTKTMISLEGRLFDAGEEGWQQEHWSVAPLVAMGCTAIGCPG